MQRFYSNGKLLLTGEYVVLDGAKALALPTCFGQSLDVEEINSQKLLWKSLDHNEIIWFEKALTKQLLAESFTKFDDSILRRLFSIFISAKRLNPNFLSSGKGYSVTTKLDFPRDWGLGTSSTLTNNFANWAKVDAYKLLELTFGGSGYDIACAQFGSPITYQIIDNKRTVESVNFYPEFKDHLYFIHLNTKRESSDAIEHYKNQDLPSSELIDQISHLTDEMIQCDSLNNFGKHIDEHEAIISNLIKEKTIKQRLFSDFKGSIKSLGAWGGDFIMVVSENDPRSYFHSKGFSTILTYDQIILKK